MNPYTPSPAITVPGEFGKSLVWVSIVALGVLAWGGATTVAAAPASLASAVSSAAPASSAAPVRGSDMAAWVKEIETERASRVERLRSDLGWLSVVGLYWFQPGENAFGTDPKNAIVLPAGTAPAIAGSFFLDGKKVRVTARPDAGLMLDGKEIREKADLAGDDAERRDDLKLGDLTMYVIRRGERAGLRVKNPKSAARRDFKGLEYFPISASYKVTAEFVPYDPPKQIPVPTVLGTIEPMPSPGLVRFRLNGQELTLDPVLEDPASDELFYIFKDQTAGKETYPAGRFLYSALPKDGKVVLDFNLAVNPPCAFTEFATCPMPPKQNALPVRVEAGEKNYGHH